MNDVYTLTWAVGDAICGEPVYRRRAINAYARRLLARHPEYEYIRVEDQPILGRDGEGGVTCRVNAAYLYGIRREGKDRPAE